VAVGRSSVVEAHLVCHLYFVVMDHLNVLEVGYVTCVEMDHSDKLSVELEGSAPKDMGRRNGEPDSDL